MLWKLQFRLDFQRNYIFWTLTATNTLMIASFSPSYLQDILVTSDPAPPHAFDAKPMLLCKTFYRWSGKNRGYNTERT